MKRAGHVPGTGRLQLTSVYYFNIERVETELTIGRRLQLLHVQQVTVYTPMTWGLYLEPPPDVPACGFLGEFCIPPVKG